jgi:signal transduction histidine kinase
MRQPFIQKSGIRRKVTLIICLSTMTVMLIGIALGYFFGFRALQGMVGDVHRRLSQLLAGNVTIVFDREMERIMAYAGDPSFRDAVAKSNTRYETMAPAHIAGYLAEMNKDWAKARKTGPLVREYVDSEQGLKLKALAGRDANLAEAALYDRYGALVAASGKPSAFYLGNIPEEILSGKIRIFVGDAEFDEVQSAWVIPVISPIRGQDGGVIGVFRCELSTEKFFSFLGAFMVDKTGHAVLIDGRGNVIYHPGAAQTNLKLCGDRDYNRLLTSIGKYATIYEPNIHKRMIFVAFSEVTPPVLLESNKVWRVLISQDVKEVFRSLNSILGWMMIAIGFLLLVMVGIGYFFSGVLVRPILELQKAVAEIMKGNWNYRVDIHTGDEIEQFADAFKAMVSDIQAKQDQLLKTQEMLERLSKGLEAQVRERTVDLTMAKDRLDKYTRELEGALVVKTDFISMASHELRTPLAAIKEGIGIVLAGKTGPVNERQEEFLDMAKRNLDRLSRLITDILDFQKLEYGKMALKIEPHDINEVVREVCNTMMSLAQEKGLGFIAELAVNLPPIKFDKDKITQVITNLLSNAIKFTEKGSITVTTGKGQNVIQVSVADTGPGIKEEEMPLLFQKFTQLEKGLERKTGGSGLGLTISKEIVEMHNGKIWAESKVGEGSTFYFILPIKERRADR